MRGATRPWTDAKLALAILYYVQCGPNEHTGTPQRFLDKIGGQNTPVNQRSLGLITEARQSGVPVHKIAVEKVAQDLLGWDAVRASVAFSEAQAEGWVCSTSREAN